MGVFLFQNNKHQQLRQGIMSNAITFNQVSKSYARQTVLDNINIDIKEGEFIGLVGINGAGKTTLIKSMLDFTDIDSGEIFIQGINHKKTASRSNLAYLPERFYPPSHLNGRNFIKYMLELHQKKYNQHQLESLLEKLDFDTGNLSKYIQNYSKGMTQKLGLASAFLSERPLLILDEPMSGLDPKARKHLKEYFSHLKQQQKHTLFISTHLLADAAAICDQLIVLNNANIVYQGTPQGLLNKYTSTDFDSAFVNCISAR